MTSIKRYLKAAAVLGLFLGLVWHPVSGQTVTRVGFVDGR